MKASMRFLLVIEAQPSSKGGLAVLGVSIWSDIGPFAQQGLDHALGLAVGLGSIRSSSFGDDAKPAVGFAKRPRAIGATVVGQHSLDANATCAERAHGPQPKSSGGIALFVGQDFDVGEARAV